MAINKKISELPDAGSLGGSETFPVVQDATTKKATVSSIIELVTASTLVFGDNLVITSEGVVYIKSNGLSGADPGPYFFKLEVQDDGTIPQPLNNTGFNNINDLIDSL